MLVKYIKSNWFTLALILLGILAFMKNKLPFGLGSPAHAIPVMEKYTDSGMGITSSPLTEGKLNLSLEDQAVKAFLERFVNVALGEKKKFQIPAAVILGTALLNSQAGRSDAAVQRFNYFNLSGPGASPNYKTAWESFRGFSSYLSNQAWFPAVQGSGKQDCATWAKALQKHVYTNVPNFETALCTVIEKYDLNQLDASR